jgi:hypothetical protein
MQKLFDAAVDYPLVLIAANEEFPRERVLEPESAEQSPGKADGWNPFEIWYRRIRPAPGVHSIFLPRR